MEWGSEGVIVGIDKIRRVMLQLCAANIMLQKHN